MPRATMTISLDSVYGASYAGPMTNHTPPKMGDRVKFVGLRPRSHETVGIVTAVRGEYVEVVWGDRPGFLHRSQVEVV